MDEIVKLNLKYSGIKSHEIMKYSSLVKDIHIELNKSKNDINEFTGWLDLPEKYDIDELEKIKKIANKVKNDSDVLIVIGIGGSYLGAKAAIDLLTKKYEKNGVEVLYVGNNLSADYINEIIDYVSNKEISLNVISKSGKTTEPAIAFRLFRDFMENKYGVENARKRIFITTSKKKGALYKIAIKDRFARLYIPDNIGGRYSVLTAVGLLPMAVAGIDIDKVLDGAKIAAENFNNEDLKTNECYKYAVARNVLYKKDKNIELLATYEPKMTYFAEWWKQLFGESEGKNHRGIFPASVVYTTDLHSLGQYVQEGRRNLFETVINIKKSSTDIKIGFDDENLDELNYIAGKTISYVQKKAMLATVKAHSDGDVPNLVLSINKINEQSIGYLIYFFEKACAMSAKILGVNPFDQPGVEKYKENMYKLLGKYE